MMHQFNTLLTAAEPFLIDAPDLFLAACVEGVQPGLYLPRSS